MKTIIAAAVVCACVAFSVAHAASVAYQYVGNPFTTFNQPAPDGLTRVTGTMLFAERLPANLNIVTVGEPSVIFPMSFEFSNGVANLTEETHRIQTDVLVTDANGDIINWMLFISLSPMEVGDFSISTRNAPDIASVADVTNYCHELIDPNGCYVSQTFSPRNPGTWTTIIPIPSAVGLFGSALALLGWMRREQHLAHTLTEPTSTR